MRNNSGSQAVEETINHAFSVVRPFLSLTDQELEHIREVSSGRLGLNTLFPEDEQVAAELSEHPALLWKIKNVQKVLG
ncbi:MAG: hypothetical protein R6U51_04930 [Anaerolineales bacterium]